MRKISVSMTSRGVSEWMAIDRRGTSGDDYLVILEMDEGSGLADFEFSPDRPENTMADARPAPTIVITHNILHDCRNALASTLTVPFQSFRLNVKSYRYGTITATVVQGGVHGN